MIFRPTAVYVANSLVYLHVNNCQSFVSVFSCDQLSIISQNLLRLHKKAVTFNRKRENGKKGYTDEELAAAVSDIRSGKLGTRRAASLYGIPRSTLRNKIFRMGGNSESAAGAHLPHNSSDYKLSMFDLLQNCLADEEGQFMFMYRGA